MIKGIIFDKDGTLLDFDAMWYPVADRTAEDILKTLGADVPKEKILSALGVHDGSVSINGVLCWGTYGEMAVEIQKALAENGFEASLGDVEKAAVESFHKNIMKGEIRPSCSNISEFLKGLRDRGIKLAVVTTDDPYATGKSLDALGITEHFDRIYTADGIRPPKPDPQCIYEFCNDEGLKPEELLMVGDTLTDMNFAKNGGIKAIGVAKNETNKNILLTMTDKVVEDISKIGI